MQWIIEIKFAPLELDILTQPKIIAFNVRRVQGILQHLLRLCPICLYCFSCFESWNFTGM